MESIDVPDIIPATTSDSFEKSSPRLSRDINPYVKRALEISEDNFLELSDNSFQKLFRLQHFLSKYKNLLLEPTAGSGTFAIEFAARHSDWGVIAVEARFKRAVRAFQKSCARGVKNIFIIRGKFEDIEDDLPCDAFDAIYLAFPDPWDRSKWTKHRIYENSDRFKRLLKGFGRLILKTDNNLVAQNFIRSMLGQLRLGIIEFPFVEQDQRLRTDFEKLFLSKKQGIWLVSFYKIPDAISCLKGEA
ncbi:MAG: hypothetical protein QXL01_06390 [Thermoplasmatales archaeon]